MSLASEYLALARGSVPFGESCLARFLGLEVPASNLELTSLRVSSVSAEILQIGTGVSQPLGGSE